MTTSLCTSPPQIVSLGHGDHTPIASPSKPPELPPVPIMQVGGVSPASCDVERDGMQPASVMQRSPDQSHDESHDMEEGGNLSGVSDISSESMIRDSAPTATGPQTPPLPSEATPTTLGAGVSDISSDNMEAVSLQDSADISISEDQNNADTSDASLEQNSVTPAPLKSLGEGVSIPAARESVLMEVEGAGSEGRCLGMETEGDTSLAMTSSEEILDSNPSLSADSGSVVGRPPPLDALGSTLAPPSPLSTQTTPSKTPGKRKVCNGSCK